MTISTHPTRCGCRLAAKLLAVLALAFAVTAGAAERITLERIMSDPDWLGNSPEAPFWHLDGESVIFMQKREGQRLRDPWRIDLESGEIHKADSRELARAGARDVAFDRSHRRAVFVQNGNVFVRDMDQGKLRQLTRGTMPATDAFFMADDFRVAWRSGQDHFAYDLETGLVEQLAQLRFEKDPLKEPEAFDFLRDQQLRLFDILAREREWKHDEIRHERELRQRHPERGPVTFYLGNDIEAPVRSMAPSGKHLLLVTQPAQRDDGRRDLMPNYVSYSGYVETEEVRRRVGLNEPVGQQLRLLDIENDRQHRIDLSRLPGISDDPHAALRPRALEWHLEHGARRESAERALEAPEVRPLRYLGAQWHPEGRLVAVMLRSVDNKDRWIVVLDTETGDMHVRHRLTDPAWINWAFNDFGWLPGSERLWLLSEESGYSQLYLTDARRGQARALTSGRQEVSEPMVDRRGEYIYYRSNALHPGRHEIYRVSVDRGRSEQLTELGGTNSFVLSPDESRLLVTHSSALRHPDLYLVEVGDPDSAHRLTDTMSEEFKQLPWIEPQIVEVPSSEASDPIYTRLYLPPDHDPDKSYPAVFFIHGAGYLQNAHEGWSSYFREFMFHSLLAHEGYVVMDMDYRASAGYGRDWRTDIYRRMGHPELVDHVDGVNWVVENHSVDPDRVGVYGGSYGGFMTFMALFREPELFAAGAALRPVSDWASYNHPYTSNILNTPAVDPMAYERSSPIEYADGLKRPLLITHGVLDDNVFYQDVVRLVQRLIELGKTDFEAAMYPLEPHGFVHPESWLDQYRRIHSLFDKHVK
jgi:dipeptidyl aminopeptidase/acylaminoacyl peptidase